MKKSHLVPAALLAAGLPFLAWQRYEISQMQAAVAAAGSGHAASGDASAGSGKASPDAARSLAGKLPAGSDAASGTDRGTAANDKTPESAAGSISGAPDDSGAISLASLTMGAERSANLKSDNKVLLAAPIAMRLHALNAQQAATLFGKVTKLLATISEEEMEAGRSEDPEKMRAMLLLFPLMSRMQKESPSTLLDWMVSPLLPSFFRKQGVGNFAEATMQRWASDDPRKALAWYDAHSDSVPEGPRVQTAALLGLARNDFPAAMAEARKRDLVREATSAVIPALTTPEARTEWTQAVMTLDDSDRRGRRWTSLMHEQVRAEGWQAAAAILTGELPAEALTRDNLAIVSEAGMASAPGEVAAFLGTLPPDTAAAAMPGFVSQWTERDYNAAATWLREAPPDAAWRDEAVCALVEKIAPLDTEAAKAWAATVKNPALRQRLNVH